MDYVLSDKELALQGTVAEFMERECQRELARALDRQAKFPAALFDKMVEAGLLAIPFPERYDGAGGSVFDLVLLLEAMSQKMTAAAFAYAVSIIAGGETILLSGSEEQREALLPEIVAGRLRFALAMTEPQAGSDLSAIETTAKADGEGYCVNGLKMFCYGAHAAHKIIVLAKTSDGQDPLQSMALLMVDAQATGATIRPLDQLGHRAVSGCEVVFRDVRVPKENLIGEENEGFRNVMKTVAIDRTAAAAICVGMAQAAFDDASQFAKQRIQFGRPISKHQAIRHALAEIATALDGARLATYHAASLAARGERFELEASIAKLWASRTCVRAAERGMQILGGYSNLMEYDMQRYYRDAKAMEIAGGTTEIQKNQVARWIGVK